MKSARKSGEVPGHRHWTAHAWPRAFFPREAARKHLKRELQGPYADRVWAHLAGTPGKPFTAGEHGQIAMKVIDNRGREPLMVSKLSEAEKE